MRRVTVVFLAVGLLTPVALVVARFRGSHGPAVREEGSIPRGDASATASKSLVGGPTTAAAPIDFEAARRSGIAAVACTGEVVAAGFISRRDVIARFASATYAPMLADETSQAIASMMIDLGGASGDALMRVVEQPIAATVETSSSGATVRVWSVTVIGLPGTARVRQTWRTVTLDMVLADGRWLVDHWASSPGPMPAVPSKVFGDDPAHVLTRLAWPTANDAVVVA